jgi:hypothetical protein
VATTQTGTASEPQGQPTASASTTQATDPVSETVEKTQTAPLIASESHGPIAPAGQSDLSLESEDDAA